MKKIFLSLLLLATSTLSFSQSMIFCEKVSQQDGKPEKPSHIFRIGRDGGFFQLLAVLDKPVNTAEVKIDIFKVDDTGKESFDATVTVNTQPEWVWFSKQLNFFKGGDYTVYAYTAEDKLLCTGMVKVILE
ncbi:MAG: hypothetical protein ABI763_00435 [Bacteroidota bacterium]